MRAAVVLVLLYGCIEPAPEIQCGDLICPATSVCLANGTCASHDDVAACDNLADGDACQTPVFAGTCRGGACYPPVCGDGLVEGSEQCDGGVTDTDCVDYGFDTGVPTCVNCVLDVINTCVRFGWRQINAVSANAAWTDGSRFAVIRRDNTGVDIFNGKAVAGTLLRPNYFFITGNAHTIVAGSTSEIQLFDGTQFIAIDTSAILAGGAAIQRLQLGLDDTLYAVTITQTQAFVWTHSPSGTWTQIRNAANNDYEFFVVDGGLILYAAKNGPGCTVQHWTGTAWAPTGLASGSEGIFDMRVLDGAIYAATATHVLVYSSGVTTTYAESVAQVVPLASGLYAGGGGGNAVDRLESMQWVEAVDAPIQGNLISDGQRMYIVGNGTYLYTGEQYALRFSPSPIVDDLALLENGMPAAVGLNQAMVPMLQNRISWDYTTLNYNAVAVAGKTDNDFYVTNGQQIDHVANHSSTMVTMAPANMLKDMWMGGNTLYLVGINQAAFTLVGSTLTPITAPAGTMGCDLTSVAGNTTDVFASVTCGGQGAVWQLAGGAWTELHHSSVRLAAVATDAMGDVFVAGPSGGGRMVGGVWTDDPSALGVSIAATTISDVWVAGGLESVIHWDGTSWSRLGVAGSSHPRVVVTAREVTISGVTIPVLLR